MDHVRTSPYYPQSDGKIERWHQSLKTECVKSRCPLSLEDARRIVAGFVEHYNTKCLHSAIGYITPKDKIAGREKAIFDCLNEVGGQARARQAEAENFNIPNLLLVYLSG